MGCGCNCSSPGMMIGVMVAAGAVIATAVSVGGWGDKPEPSKVGVAGLVQPEGVEMSPEMAAWIEAGTPDEHHALLEAMAGDWIAHSVTTMVPGEPPEESTGRETNEMILGGRFLFTHFEGTFSDMPFEGSGVMGYDKVQKKWVSAWVDSFSTMIGSETGAYDEDTRTWTMGATMKDPLGNMVQHKSVHTIVSDSERTLTFFERSSDGEEWRQIMIITYTRN